jgi:hypothetical protein
MANEKVYSFKINGIEESVQGVESLGESLENTKKTFTSTTEAMNYYYQVTEEANKKRDAIDKLEEQAFKKKIKQQFEYKNAVETVNNDLKRYIDGENMSYYEQQQLLTSLGKVIKTSTGDTEELIAVYNQLNDQLKAVDETMGNHQRNVGNYSSALKDAKGELKEIKGEMLGFDQHSKEFEELAQRAGELTDKIGDINDAIKRTASDTSKLDNVIDVAKTATAAFGLWKGVMTEFGFETKGAEEAMQDLMGAMTIIQSLQTLSETLQSTSASAKLLQTAMKLTGAEMLINQANAMKATVANETLTKAQKVGTLATQGFSMAMKAIPFMLVIGLIATLVTHWDDLVGWIDKTIPGLKGVGGAMNGLKAVVMGLGKAILNWLTNPIVTFAKVIKKVFSGDFKGAIDEAMNGLKNQFKGTADAFNKGFKEQVNRGQEEITQKQAKEEAKRLEHQGKMIEKQKNADGTYTKEFIKNKEAQFEAQKKMYKKGSDEYNKVLEDEVAWNREKNSAIESANKKTSAATIKEYKKQQEELKKLTEELEKARIKLEADANKAIEEDRKKALEEAKKAAKELENAKKAEADATLRLNLAIIDSEKNKAQEQVDAAKEILKAKPFDQKALKEYQAGMERLYKLELERIELNKKANDKKALDDLTNKLKEAGVQFEDINDLLDTSKGKYKDLTEAQQLMIDTYFKGIEENAVKAQTEVDKLQKKMSNSGTSVSAGSESKKKQSGNRFKSYDGKGKGGASVDWDEVGTYIQDLDEAFIQPFQAFGDAIGAMMDVAIEEAEAKLEEAEELHDKAVEKVEESQDRITELRDKMKDSSGAQLEQYKQQMAEETMLLQQREAEERRLAKEKEKREQELEKEKKKKRKLELKQQLVDATVSGALAVVNGLATKPFLPLGIAMGALAATATAIQIAAISKQLSKLADGAILGGKPHSQGGIKIPQMGVELEGGEAVINKKSTAKYLPLLDRINAEGNGGKHTLMQTANNIRKFADGGVMNYQRIDDNFKTLDVSRNIESAIGNINFQPKVSVVEIARGINNLTQVRELAGGSKLIND